MKLKTRKLSAPDPAEPGKLGVGSQFLCDNYTAACLSQRSTLNQLQQCNRSRSLTARSLLGYLKENHNDISISEDMVAVVTNKLR